MAAKTQGERLATLEQRLSDHESRCEERLGEIKATSATTLKAIDKLSSRFWMIAVAVLGWALVQLWATVPHATPRPVLAAMVAVAPK